MNQINGQTKKTEEERVAGVKQKESKAQNALKSMLLHSTESNEVGKIDKDDNSPEPVLKKTKSEEEDDDSDEDFLGLDMIAQV